MMTFSGDCGIYAMNKFTDILMLNPRARLTYVRYHRVNCVLFHRRFVCIQFLEKLKAGNFGPKRLEQGAIRICLQFIKHLSFDTNCAAR